MPGNAAFHPTIETVGFQTAFSVKDTGFDQTFPRRRNVHSSENALKARRTYYTG
jgi:hypothetical protein